MRYVIILVNQKYASTAQVDWPLTRCNISGKLDRIYYLIYSNLTHRRHNDLFNGSSVNRALLYREASAYFLYSAFFYISESTCEKIFL